MADKVTEMFAFVILDDGYGKCDEGIPAFNLNGIAMPLVGADMLRMNSLRPLVKQLTRNGSIVELRKFTQMEVIEVFDDE